MKLDLKLSCLSCIVLGLSLVSAQGSFGETAPVEQVGPSQREECAVCHKGSFRHQIDDSRDPWCVNCHKLHHVGNNLGLETYFNRFARISHDEKGVLKAEDIVAQRMVRIPEGEFIMGEDFSKKSLGPRHIVTLPPYLIDQYHVTNAHYKQFVDATGHMPPPHWFGPSPPASKLNHPVTFVSWFDANDYCRWAGKRLPTEAEWEKAARGTDGRMFPWGAKYLKKRANVTSEGFNDTTPVDALPEGVSPYGVFDMAGNVFQWTSDWFLPYPGNEVPHPNFGKTLKVLRGGSFFDCSFYKCGISFQTFNRISLMKQTKSISAGFRCVQSLPPDSKQFTK